MEAPVPASALIHSATLVSAGIYLILRFNCVFDSTQYCRFVIPVVGSLTASYGGVCASAQTDVKKVLAYSTISHCGFLMVLCASEVNELVILYLYSHGFFKAGVFMCVGNVLCVTRGYQDFRSMGVLAKYLPFEHFCILVGVLNLAGLPFTFGFFAKHLIFINLGTHIHLYVFILFNSLLGALSGLFYSYNLLYYVFDDFKKGHKVIYSCMGKHGYNSDFYSNSTLAATLSILGLYFVAYVQIYLLLQYMMVGNYLFCDCMCTANVTNYYTIKNTFRGSLSNYSYINISTSLVLVYSLSSRFRGVPRLFTIYYTLYTSCILVILFILFISIL
jgi:NADH:ubiquinone oxidoreductase subunit 5 (subunit L)/multisubunit Na+/H+ antiporter MnhA subunit